MTAHPSVPQTSASDGAHIIKIPPPLYLVAAFAVGRGLDAIVGWPIEWTALRWAGAVVAAAGLALVVGGIVGVAIHRTTIVPHREVRMLVRTGAYAISRNPMYTGLSVGFVGLTLATGSWWPMVTLPIGVAALRYLVIGPEEKYLAARYPDEYREYCGRVRRWL